MNKLFDHKPLITLADYNGFLDIQIRENNIENVYNFG